MRSYKTLVESGFILFFASLLTFSTTAFAEEIEQFLSRVKSAVDQPSIDARKSAIANLFYTEGTDEVTKKFHHGAVKMLAGLENPTVELIPIPEGKKFVKAYKGFEYRENLEPIGMIEFLVQKDSQTRMGPTLPYGETSGRYYLTSTIRKPVEN